MSKMNARVEQPGSQNKSRPIRIIRRFGKTTAKPCAALDESTKELVSDDGPCQESTRPAEQLQLGKRTRNDHTGSDADSSTVTDLLVGATATKLTKFDSEVTEIKNDVTTIPSTTRNTVSLVTSTDSACKKGETLRNGPRLVDDFFKDFLSSKMKLIEDERQVSLTKAKKEVKEEKKPIGNVTDLAEDKFHSNDKNDKNDKKHKKKKEKKKHKKEKDKDKKHKHRKHDVVSVNKKDGTKDDVKNMDTKHTKSETLPSETDKSTHFKKKRDRKHKKKHANKSDSLADKTDLDTAIAKGLSKKSRDKKSKHKHKHKKHKHKEKRRDSLTERADKSVCDDKTIKKSTNNICSIADNSSDIPKRSPERFLADIQKRDQINAADESDKKIAIEDPCGTAVDTKHLNDLNKNEKLSSTKEVKIPDYNCSLPYLASEHSLDSQANHHCSVLSSKDSKVAQNSCCDAVALDDDSSRVEVKRTVTISNKPATVSLKVDGNSESYSDPLSSKNVLKDASSFDDKFCKDNDKTCSVDSIDSSKPPVNDSQETRTDVPSSLTSMNEEQSVSKFIERKSFNKLKQSAGGYSPHSDTSGTIDDIRAVQETQGHLRIHLTTAGFCKSKETVIANQSSGIPLIKDFKKKPTVKLDMKISQSSADLISSGVKVEEGSNREDAEEGEIVDSVEEETEKGNGDSSSSDVDKLSTSGSLSESGEEKKLAAKAKKKRRNEKKTKRKKSSRESGHSSRKKRKSHRSKSPEKKSKSRSYEYDKNAAVWRSRSRSRDRRTGRSRSRSRSRERSRWRYRRSPSYDRSRDVHRVRRSRSRERRPVHSRLNIDKTKLREIAIRNAYANMQKGIGPQVELKQDEIAAMKAGGKSVEELTKFCQKIADFEGGSDGSDSSTSSDGEMARVADDDITSPFIRHPFRVKDTLPNIVMNIRNAKQLPVHTPAEKIAKAAELRLQFPVSSGTQHRATEEWIPVEKSKVHKTTSNAVVDPWGTNPIKIKGTVTTTAQTTTTTTATDITVFPEPPKEPINVGLVVSERLSAIRRLQSNPQDSMAIDTMAKAQQKMSAWAESKQLPGQFTGSTNVNVLTPQELQGGFQTWVRKDTFTKAAPVAGGIGKSLLQKMGWKEGEGLGKNKEGATVPLMLDFKIDRKGLTSSGESTKKPNLPAGYMKKITAKHPVSALTELCTRRKWGAPDFQLIHESGPDHKKNFLFKVVVKGVPYQPAVAGTNKKQARAEAALNCLQQLGLIT